MAGPTEEEILHLIEHSDEDGCGPEGHGDEVDKAIQEKIELLLKCNYEESSAIEAVYDGLAGLIEDEQIPDTPLTNDTHEQKLAWVEQFNGKIRNKLISMGLDLTEG